MSFWESEAAQAAQQGGKYLTAPEKAALIENGTALQITGVRLDEKNQFQGNAAPRYVVTFQVPNALTGENEERLAGFALNPDGSSRDRLLAALVDYLASEDAEPVFVVLEKIGQFVSITKADV
jgi:hypothetical protein